VGIEEDKKVMDTRLIETEDVKAWDMALAGIPHGIAHTRGFVACLARSTGIKVRLFVAESDNGRAVCPIAERSYQGTLDVYSPYGFGGFVGSGVLTGLRNAWSLFAQGRGYVASYLMQHPVLTPPDISQLWNDGVATDRTAFIVDLKCSEEERWRRVSARKRADLRKWIQTARPEVDQIALADAFFTLYPAFTRRREMVPLYNFSETALRELASLPQVFFVGVRDDEGGVCCVALMSATKECGDYLFMAATSAGDVNGSGVLWLGLQELTERGVVACNLGGGIQEGDGVGEMKRRLGGRAQPLSGIKEVFDMDRYHAVCDAAGRPRND